MNLIFCADDCKHQKNGECQINSTKVSNVSNNNGCPYYERRTKLGTNAKNFIPW